MKSPTLLKKASIELTRFLIFALFFAGITAVSAAVSETVSNKWTDGTFKDNEVLTASMLQGMQVDWSNISNRPVIPAGQTFGKIIKLTQSQIDAAPIEHTGCNIAGGFETTAQLMVCQSECHRECSTKKHGYNTGNLIEWDSNGLSTGGTPIIECACSW